MNRILSCRTILLFLILFTFVTFAFYQLPIGKHSSLNTVPKNESQALAANDDGMIPTPPIPPYPDVDMEPNERLEFLNLGRSNTVMCWPSVGGIIAADNVQSVELDFLGLDRFHAMNRTYNVTEEDIFCRKLRLVGGKWWISYWDYVGATQAHRRKMTTEEEQVLYLGWPKSGGVWVLRLPSHNYFWYGFDRAKNAHTMEERCTALKLSGAMFFEHPKDCVYVKPLLDGFGEDKPLPVELDEHGAEL